MLRGEIRLVDLDPAHSGEAGKRCPAVIVSNDGANTAAGRLGRSVITVIPVTANLRRVYPFQVFLSAARTGLDSDAKAQAEQVRSVSIDRVLDKLGNVPLRLEIDEARRLHLSL